MDTCVLNCPVLVMEHWIPVWWLHPCPAVSAPAPRTAHWFCHRDRQKEIDDHVGKWQAGEKLTCKWCRERERRGRAGTFLLCICGCRERQYVWRVLVTAQQLLHVCRRGKGGKPLLFFSSFEKQPYPVAWCCCHGVGLFWKGEREQKLWVAVNIIGKGAIISLSLSLSLTCWSLFACCLLATKNSLVQTLWQHLILDLGNKKISRIVCLHNGQWTPVQLRNY